jgi:hypothetical protein
MSKTEYVNLETVKEALEKFVKNDAEIQKVLDLLSASTVAVDETAPVGDDPGAEGPEGEEGDAPPKVKQQFVILVSDPKGQIKSDLTGWVLQMPEDEDCREVVNGIKKAAYNFNASKKGRKYPVSSIGQAIGEVSNKFLKPYYVKVKTKEPVYVVTTDNTLPKS